MRQRGYTAGTVRAAAYLTDMVDHLVVVVVALIGLVTAAVARGSQASAENGAYKLTVRCEGGEVLARLDEKASGLVVVDGPVFYSAEPGGGLESPEVKAKGDALAISGKLAGLDLEQTLTLPRNKAWMEERMVLRNGTPRLVRVDKLQIGFTRRVSRSSATSASSVSAVSSDVWSAVPLRHRATDPNGYYADFTMQELLDKPGWEPEMVDGNPEYRQLPSPHHISEGWAWLHGGRGTGIFKFSQECMQFSVVTKVADDTLCFGGACTISGEPCELSRLAPGHSLDLGVTRYEPVEGGYEQVAYAYRRMLDEHGCRFPKDYAPPVHWEQLYDMEGAWNDRPQNYTLEALRKEAEKGVAYSCEALYLDPGWDTACGSFIWGEWLGPEKRYVKDLHDKYGLKLSLHCPLATWMSMSQNWLMGPDAAPGWPQAAKRIPPPHPGAEVPATYEGRRNLALLPDAKPTASSVFENGSWPIHQTAHLNDGWYGNAASWIAGEMPCWVQVDLGAEFRISKVVLGNEHFGAFADRAATELRVLVATREGEWTPVAEYKGDGLHGTTPFTFAPVAARYVRVEMTKSNEGLPRLDEIEVYEAEPTPGEFAARRGPQPAPSGGPRLCLGSKQYLDEAERRVLKLCEEGATFLMYDGTWWNGGCLNPDHAHPVPYRYEDHIRANIDLVERIHRKFPKVVIELHDTLAGGSSARPTPLYYKYGLPLSYDDNWGFELMWDPMADLKEGRGASLYYANLGCNVPMYLHIDLRKDNEECVVLWWYASTCRHLGIGGTNKNPKVVRAEQAAMKQYKQWERFFKRGDFYGAGEQIHLHVLPKERAFVANVFNLSDKEQTITGTIPLSETGLPAGAYSGTADWGAVSNGVFRVSAKLPPWSARVAEFRAP